MKKKKKELDWGTDTKKFPTVWETDEMAEVKIDDVINKHVYLAVADFFESAHIALTMQDGKVEIYLSVGDDEWEPRFISLDDLVSQEIEIHDAIGDEVDEALIEMADEFQRLADKLRRGSGKSGQ